MNAILQTLVHKLSSPLRRQTVQRPCVSVPHASVASALPGHTAVETEAIASFERLKRALAQASDWAPLRDGCPYALDCDVSDYGCGAVLSQDEELRAIGFALQTFNVVERNRCLTSCRLCAIMFGLENYRSYLLRTKFAIRMDHRALMYLMSVK